MIKICDITKFLIDCFTSSDAPNIDPEYIHVWPPAKQQDKKYMYITRGANIPLSRCQRRQTIRIHLHENASCWGKESCSWDIDQLYCDLEIVKVLLERKCIIPNWIDYITYITSSDTIDDCGDNVIVADFYIFYSRING